MFTFFSLLCNVFIIGVIYLVFKVNNIKFDKKDLIAIGITICGLYLFYILSVVFRRFIYYWDYSCYYSISITSIQQYEQGLISGIKHFLSSTWGGEYGNFLCYISQIIFAFTSKTPNAYLISCVILFIPYLVVSFCCMLKTLKVDTVVGLIIFALFPILHVQFIYGQPDIFGLVAIFLIISLCATYDFTDKQLLRWILIIICTLLLLIVRRWYLYLIVAFYVCYVAYLFIINFKDKQKVVKIIKNGLVFFCISLVVFAITMGPFFKNVILSNNLSNYSESYLVYGFWGELFAQVKRLGLVLTLVVICGCITSLCDKKYRIFSILGIIHFFIIVFLFTRTQNMGLHHNLLLVPVYLYFIYSFVIFIKKAKCQKIVLLLFICVYTLNFLFGFYQNKKTWICSKINLIVPEEKNFTQIGQVVDWLYDNLGDDQIYLINHDAQFNPDKFRRYKMPDTFIGDKMAYGSTVYGTHTFPTELFTCKYIMLVEPLIPNGLNKIYYDVFTKLRDDKFEIVQTFDMADNYKAIIYKRVQSVSVEETNLYLESLQIQSSKYPYLYKDVIKQFVSENLQ